MKNPSNDIPNALRDAHYKSAAKLGHGVDYKYPHDYPDHWIEQQYLPDSVKDEKFYYPSDMGYEATINKRLNDIKNKN
jgi:putative ATPase